MNNTSAYLRTLLFLSVWLFSAALEAVHIIPEVVGNLALGAYLETQKVVPGVDAARQEVFTAIQGELLKTVEFINGDEFKNTVDEADFNNIVALFIAAYGDKGLFKQLADPDKEVSKKAAEAITEQGKIFENAIKALHEKHSLSYSPIAGIEVINDQLIEHIDILHPSTFGAMMRTTRRTFGKAAHNVRNFSSSALNTVKNAPVYQKVAGGVVAIGTGVTGVGLLVKKMIRNARSTEGSGVEGGNRRNLDDMPTRKKQRQGKVDQEAMQDMAAGTIIQLQTGLYCFKTPDEDQNTICAELKQLEESVKRFYSDDQVVLESFQKAYAKCTRVICGGMVKDLIKEMGDLTEENVACYDIWNTEGKLVTFEEFTKANPEAEITYALKIEEAKDGKKEEELDIDGPLTQGKVEFFQKKLNQETFKHYKIYDFITGGVISGYQEFENLHPDTSIWYKKIKDDGSGVGGSGPKDKTKRKEPASLEEMKEKLQKEKELREAYDKTTLLGSQDVKNAEQKGNESTIVLSGDSKEDEEIIIPSYAVVKKCDSSEELVKARAEVTEKTFDEYLVFSEKGRLLDLTTFKALSAKAKILFIKKEAFDEEKKAAQEEWLADEKARYKPTYKEIEKHEKTKGIRPEDFEKYGYTLEKYYVFNPITEKELTIWDEIDALRGAEDFELYRLKKSFLGNPVGGDVQQPEAKTSEVDSVALKIQEAYKNFSQKKGQLKQSKQIAGFKAIENLRNLNEGSHEIILNLIDGDVVRLTKEESKLLHDLESNKIVTFNKLWILKMTDGSLFAAKKLAFMEKVLLEMDDDTKQQFEKAHKLLNDQEKVNRITIKVKEDSTTAPSIPAPSSIGFGSIPSFGSNVVTPVIPSSNFSFGAPATPIVSDEQGTVIIQEEQKLKLKDTEKSGSVVDPSTVPLAPEVSPIVEEKKEEQKKDGVEIAQEKLNAQTEELEVIEANQVSLEKTLDELKKESTNIQQSEPLTPTTQRRVEEALKDPKKQEELDLLLQEVEFTKKSDPGLILGLPDLTAAKHGGTITTVKQARAAGFTHETHIFYIASDDSLVEGKLKLLNQELLLECVEKEKAAEPVKSGAKQEAVEISTTPAPSWSLELPKKTVLEGIQEKRFNFEDYTIVVATTGEEVNLKKLKNLVAGTMLKITKKESKPESKKRFNFLQRKSSKKN